MFSLLLRLAHQIRFLCVFHEGKTSLISVVQDNYKLYIYSAEENDQILEMNYPQIKNTNSWNAIKTVLRKTRRIPKIVF